MGFNISQIINKFLPTRPHSSSADGWENPYQTGAGQLVTSEQENWQVRLARHGGNNSSNAVKVAMTQNVATTVLNVRPSPGRLAYVTHVIISADGSGVAYIGNMAKYILAGGSFEMKLDGAMLIDYEWTLKFKADNAGTTATASMMWMEVNA
jgi:hypothetical protein